MSNFKWTDELVLIALDLAHHNGYHKFPQRCVDLFDEVKNQATKGGYQYPAWVRDHLKSKQLKPEPLPMSKELFIEYQRLIEKEGRQQLHEIKFGKPLTPLTTLEEFKAYKQPVKKGPVPLFTTEDGVKIFEGGIWWIIDQEDGEIREVCVYQPNFDIKRFSTKEAAEEFCIMNKPVLSLKEITDIFEMANPSSHPPIFFNYVKNAITELVKSKLNG